MDATLLVIAGALGDRLFGPTADDVGQLLRQWTGSRISNTKRLFQRVQRRDAAAEGGSVAPRVAARVLEDGSWVSDPVTQEYYAGLLLGGRSTDGDDDSALFWVDLVSRMTTNQVRLHHAIYAAVAAAAPADRAPLSAARNGLVDYSVTGALDEINFLIGRRSVEDAVAEAIIGLHHLSLVEAYAVHVAEMSPDRPSMSATPTNTGLLLFLRAYGARTTDLDVVSGFSPTTAFNPPGPCFRSPTVGNPRYR